MECNKEEAIRARHIAEKKLQVKEYFEAQKIALRAQKLFPDLENIVQLLTVCKVHCAASSKVNGLDDWYNVLQVETTSDESLIKKQYRNLAFLLHPDKNKFAGAEAAFKLIGEAYRILSDKARRSLYDTKRKTSNRVSASGLQHNYGVNKTVNVFRGDDVGARYTGLNQKERQPSEAAIHQTFWTICTFCNVKYEYFRSIMSRNIRCQNCKMTFIAHEVKMDGPTKGVYRPVFPGVSTSTSSQQCNTGNEHFKTRSKVDASGGTRPSEDNSEQCVSANINGFPHKKEIKFEKVKLTEVDDREKLARPSEKSKNRRKRKTVVESSESDIEELMAEGTDNFADKEAGTSKNHGSRRSTRKRQKVSYTENVYDDDFVIPEISRKDGSSHDITQNSKMSSSCEVVLPTDGYVQNKMKENNKRDENMRNGHKETVNPKINQTNAGNSEAIDVEATTISSNKSDESDKAEVNPDICSYPDPEFCDFDKKRVPSAFAADQIWALFDDIDGMPRYYAKIKKVFSTGSKIQYAWLEHVPCSLIEENWVKNELPVACGTFEPKIIQTTEELPMFSHAMSWEQVPRKKGYLIQPRKGEIWALYKGWDIDWSTNLSKQKSFEYEVVMILSDYTKNIGISVAPLIRVEGFVSLFTIINDGNAKLQIPPNEMLRFSHMVPHYSMTGNERDGISEGFYELDPVALPVNFVEKFPSISLDLAKAKPRSVDVKVSTPFSESSKMEETNTYLQKEKRTFEEVILKNPHPREINIMMEDAITTSKNSRQRRKTASSEMRNHEYSEKALHNSKEKLKNLRSTKHIEGIAGNQGLSASSSHEMEFHNFQLERSDDKFKNGQIWALYSDLDHYPKHYALIKGINSDLHRAQVIWLEVCPAQDMEINWFNNDLPFGCGTFKVPTGRKTKQRPVPLATFSHIMKVESDEKTKLLYIYPRVGEVWAVYRNWSAEWRKSNITSCEYDLVEVIATSSIIRILSLVKVENYKSVFRHDKCNGAFSITDIPRNELLRFSHNVPAHRLTKSDHVNLQGCWELDAASVPKA